MMEAVGTWVLGVVALALLVAVADALTPEGVPRQVVRLVGGLLLLLVLLRPVLTFVASHWTESLSQVLSQEAEWDDSLETENRQLLEQLITQSSQAYIERQAQALGANCQVTVVCQWQEDLPVPCQVEVVGELSNSQRQALSAQIWEDFGIAPEAQTYKGESP